MGAAGRARVEQAFDRRAMIDRLERVYRQALREKASGCRIGPVDAGGNDMKVENWLLVAGVALNVATGCGRAGGMICFEAESAVAVTAPAKIVTTVPTPQEESILKEASNKGYLEIPEGVASRPGRRRSRLPIHGRENGRVLLLGPRLVDGRLREFVHRRRGWRPAVSFRRGRHLQEPGTGSKG